MRGTFLERPNRFVALVRLEDGTQAAVHVASSGRMNDLLVPGAPVIVQPSTEGKPGRKTTGLLTMVEHNGFWVSVDTARPGKILRQAFTARTLPEFAGYDQVRPEYKHGQSRIDFLLTSDGLPPCLVEVKSVTAVVPDGDGTPVARFPDAPTDRGARHLRELAAAVEQGYRTAVCFVIQRNDAAAFGPYDTIDPVFGQTLRAVARAGVEVHVWALDVKPERIALARRVPTRL